MSRGARFDEQFSFTFTTWILPRSHARGLRIGTWPISITIRVPAISAATRGARLAPLSAKVGGVADQPRGIEGA